MQRQQQGVRRFSAAFDPALQNIEQIDPARNTVSRRSGGTRRPAARCVRQARCHIGREKGIGRLRAHPPGNSVAILQAIAWPLTRIGQIAALKDGRIDVGFGRVRFEDATVQRTVLREEHLVVAIPAGHRLAGGSRPLSLRKLQEEALILYPRAPRSSYADQVVALFADHGIRPRVAHEARELQIAIGPVAAEEGICIVPESVKKSRVDDVVYRDLEEMAVSPIIMSHRARDGPPELATMARVIARHYADRGYGVPEALAAFDA